MLAGGGFFMGMMGYMGSMGIMGMMGGVTIMAIMVVGIMGIVGMMGIVGIMMVMFVVVMVVVVMPFSCGEEVVNGEVEMLESEGAHGVDHGNDRHTYVGEHSHPHGGQS